MTVDPESKSTILNGVLIQKLDFHKIFVRFLPFLVCHISIQPSLTNFQVNLEVKFKSYPSMKRYDRRLGEYSMNICRALWTVSDLFIARIIDVFKKKTNYTFSCPTKAGTYHLSDMNTNVIMFPSQRTAFHAKGDLLVFLSKDGKGRRVAFVEVTFTYTQNWSILMHG